MHLDLRHTVCKFKDTIVFDLNLVFRAILFKIFCIFFLYLYMPPRNNIFFYLNILELLLNNENKLQI